MLMPLTLRCLCVCSQSQWCEFIKLPNSIQWLRANFVAIVYSNIAYVGTENRHNLCYFATLWWFACFVICVRRRLTVSLTPDIISWHQQDCDLIASLLSLLGIFASCLYLMHPLTHYMLHFSYCEYIADSHWLQQSGKISLCKNRLIM